MPRTLRSLARPGLLLAALLAAAGGCGNAGDEFGINLPAAPGIAAQLFVDRDFNGVFTQPDTVLAGVRVFLLVAGGQGDTVQVDTTDANGQVAYVNVAPGPYAVSVDSAAALGDSLFTFLTPASVQVVLNGQVPVIAIRLGFPTDDIPGVRASAVGRRVVTSGIVLSGPQFFSDTTAHLRDLGGAIRLTDATVLIGNFVTPGDSVRVLGTVAVRNGQPVLEAAEIVLLIPGINATIVDTITTAEAAAARAGVLDADLVRIEAAGVTDSASVGGDYTVTVDDGSGPVTVVIDSVLALNPTAVVPGDSLRVNGVLVPTGTGGWVLKPRITSDLTVF